jgi:hypothetical protein
VIHAGGSGRVKIDVIVIADELSWLPLGWRVKVQRVTRLRELASPDSPTIVCHFDDSREIAVENKIDLPIECEMNPIAWRM